MDETAAAKRALQGGTRTRGTSAAQKGSANDSPPENCRSCGDCRKKECPFCSCTECQDGQCRACFKKFRAQTQILEQKVATQGANVDPSLAILMRLEASMGELKLNSATKEDLTTLRTQMQSDTKVLVAQAVDPRSKTK